MKLQQWATSKYMELDIVSEKPMSTSRGEDKTIIEKKMFNLNGQAIQPVSGDLNQFKKEEEEFMSLEVLEESKTSKLEELMSRDTGINEDAFENEFKEDNSDGEWKTEDYI
jgi:uncharacterized protein YifE (UPF0438 family)